MRAAVVVVFVAGASPARAEITDLFTVADYTPDGVAVGLVNNIAAQWTADGNNQASSVFHFARVAAQTIAKIEPANGISLSTMPPETGGGCCDAGDAPPPDRALRAGRFIPDTASRYNRLAT